MGGPAVAELADQLLHLVLGRRRLQVRLDEFLELFNFRCRGDVELQTAPQERWRQVALAVTGDDDEREHVAGDEAVPDLDLPPPTRAGIGARSLARLVASKVHRLNLDLGLSLAGRDASQFHNLELA